MTWKPLDKASRVFSRVLNPIALTGNKDPVQDALHERAHQFAHDAFKGSKQIGNTLAFWRGGDSPVFGDVAPQETAPQLPEDPGAPTLDEAKQRAQQSARIQRRRGVLANIFGGRTNTQPTVAVKTLLGS